MILGDMKWGVIYFETTTVQMGIIKMYQDLITLTNNTEYNFYSHLTMTEINK